jgi:tetratricopeptide (TPR) repeat protein
MNSNNPSRSKKSRKPTDTLIGAGFAGWVVACIVGLSTFTVFMQALSNDFVNWDDHETLLNNTRYRGLGWTELRWMFTTFYMGHYQPLSWVSFAIDFFVWGTNPVGYHLTNLLLHALNAVLFFFLARLLLSAAVKYSNDKSENIVCVSAGLAALLFSVHPLRVESVAWATERRDVLSGFFFVLTLYAYVRAHLSSDDRCRRAGLALSLCAFLLSLTAKATAITLPAVFLLLDVYPLRRLQGTWRSWLQPEGRKILWEKLPFAALGIVFAIVAAFAQQSVGALRPIQQYFLSYRLGQAAYATLFYIWKSLLPAKLSPLYELPYDFDAWMPLFILCAAAAAAITVALYVLRRHWPAGLACWLYYLVVLAPVMGIAQSGPQLVADRYSYFSCMSWAVLTGGGFLQVWSSARISPERRPAFFTICTLAVLAVLILGIMTWKQSEVWRDTKTLWQYVIAARSESGIAHYNLGRIYEDEGKLDKGIEYYRRAVIINPAYPEAHYNLARLLARQGMQEEAINHYRQVLRVRPNDADTHNNLGLLLWRKGQFKASLAELGAAVQIDPNYAKAFFNMGRIYASEGDFDNAVLHYEKALTLNPKEGEIYFGLGNALTRRGQPEAAIGYLREAVKLKPDFADAYIALARSLAAQGNKEEAEKYYQEALRVLKSRTQGVPSQ